MAGSNKNEIVVGGVGCLVVEDDVVVVGDFCAGRRGQRGFAHPGSVLGVFQFLGDGGDGNFDDRGNMRSMAYLRISLCRRVVHGAKRDMLNRLENDLKHAHRKQWESLH